MDVLDYLHSLIGLPLCYGTKSPNTELYEFGFGNMIGIYNVGENQTCPHILHVVCRFKVIWKNIGCRVDKYFEDTPYEKFNSEVKQLIGLKVKRISLSDKNDLWLDLGDIWIVFATFENDEESWRFFKSGIDAPHLVASNSSVYMISSTGGRGDGLREP